MTILLAEAKPRTGVTSVGVVASTTEPVPVDVVVPVPPLSTGRVPATCEPSATPERVPPRVSVPEVVTEPVSVMPFTVPVVATDVTVPVLVVYPAGFAAA
jgi:hypothetical protein